MFGTAGVALGVAARFAPGGGGGGGAAAGVGGGFGPGAVPLGSPARQIEVTVFIEGQGFVQDIGSMARTMGEEIARQFNNAGSLRFAGGV